MKEREWLRGEIKSQVAMDNTIKHLDQVKGKS